MSDLTILVSELGTIAKDAETFDRFAPNVLRRELQELLQRELGVEDASPGSRLRLDSVVDDAIAIVYRESIAKFADRLRDVVGDDRDDEDEVAARFHCLDCDINTAAIGEYYALRTEVWLGANPLGLGMLCIGCLEKRLGRRLCAGDFAVAAINYTNCSERLRSRVLGLEEAPTA